MQRKYENKLKNKSTYFRYEKENDEYEEEDNNEEFNYGYKEYF